jgi:ABC-type lipoprotein export system ATPase subunit/GNAT superfamily N-acetyltransferase
MTDDASAFVADAFGIESGWENKVLELDLPDELPQIVLITGESGCGKSTLLRKLAPESVIKIPKKPLCEWTDTEEEALRLLSAVGLNDASLFCLRYEALSDSQQARARMYSVLVSKTKTLVVDEFLSTLDRETAQALAYSFQKLIRREGLKLIVATAHHDLANFLRPDLLVFGKSFPSRWEVTTPEYLSDSSPFVAPALQIKIFIDKVTGRTRTGGYLDGCIFNGKLEYRKSRLAELHYKGKYLGGASEYIFATYKGREVGVLVGAKTRRWTQKDGGMRIARVVVHPSYRGCGIGQTLIREFLRMHETDQNPVETTAAMARFNPVFAKAGMTQSGESIVKPPKGLQEAVVQLGFNVTNWYSKRYCTEWTANKNHRDALSVFAKELNSRFCPGGDRSLRKSDTPKPVQEERTRVAIADDAEIAGRLLWAVRPHTMARFVSKA